MNRIYLIDFAFGIFNKASRPLKATAILVPVTRMRILNHIDTIGMNLLIEKLKRANHMIVDVTTIVKDNIYAWILLKNSLNSCWIVLASDKDLNRSLFVLLALGIYIKANNSCSNT